MSRTGRNVSNVLDSVDEGWTGLWRHVTEPPSRRTTLLGLAVVSALTLGAIPLRDTIGTANIALSIGIVVVIVGVRAGLWPGTIVALVGGGAFALVHTVPHGLPRVESEQDVATAALLVLSGVLAGWIHDRTAHLRTRLRDTDFGFARLHRVAEAAAATDTTVAQVIDVVTSEIASELHLLECRRVRDPLGSRRELQHNGMIARTPLDAQPSEFGAIVADGVGIDLRDGSHLVLIGRPETDISRHQLRLGIMLADYAAAVLDDRGGQDGSSTPDAGR